MLRLASDENVHGNIIDGLRLRKPNLDIVRVLDVGLARTPDPLILDWAASHDRIVITIDVNTMLGFAWHRVRAGQRMPGLIVLHEHATIGRAIDDIILVTTCCTSDEIASRSVVHVPL